MTDLFGRNTSLHPSKRLLVAYCALVSSAPLLVPDPMLRWLWFAACLGTAYLCTYEARRLRRSMEGLRLSLRSRHHCGSGERLAARLVSRRLSSGTPLDLTVFFRLEGSLRQSGPEQVLRDDHAVETIFGTRTGTGVVRKAIVRARTSFGMFLAIREIELSRVFVRVSARSGAVPTLDAFDTTQLPARATVGVHSRTRGVHPELFAGLREWKSGDSVRRIDARRSARHGRPLVREFESRRALRTLIVLDRGASAAMRIDSIDIDRRLVAQSVAHASAALARGDTVGLALLDSRLVTAARGIRRERELDVLPRLLAESSSDPVTDFELVRDLPRDPERRIVLVTNLDREGHRDELLAAARALPSGTIAIVDVSMQRRDAAAPNTPDTFWRAYSALDNELSHEEFRREAMRRGIELHRPYTSPFSVGQRTVNQ